MSVQVAAILMVAIAAGSISAGVAYAADPAPPPFQQQRDGVPLDAIECNEPRDLHIRDSNIPLCLYVSTYELLSGYGMDLVPSERSYADIIKAVDSIPDAGADKAQRVVRETIRMYESDRENAFANINVLSENSVLHYPFVIDPDTERIASHGASTARIGDPSVIFGNYADRPGEAILGELRNGSGTWAEYVFLDPISNEDRLKSSWLVLYDGYIFGAGYYYSPDEKINRVIDNAIVLYESGGFAAINALNASANAYYLFVVDYVTSTLVAHSAYPDRVGFVDLTSPESRDKDMTLPEVGEILKEGKEVVRYTANANPVTGEYSQKRNSYKLHDGYIFGAGYYYPAEEKVMNVVKRTIAAYDSDKEAAFASVDAQAGTLNPHYPFIIDADSGLIAAHGAFPDIIGTPSVILGNFADRPADAIMADLQNGSTWVNYTYPIPGTHFEETKRSYLELHDGYVFGSGYYFSIFTVILP